MSKSVITGAKICGNFRSNIELGGLTLKQETSKDQGFKASRVNMAFVGIMKLLGKNSTMLYCVKWTRYDK